MLNFVPLHAGALDKVLAWRTSPEVTRWMRTDVEPDGAAQQRWFERVREDGTCAHWLVRLDRREVGLAYLTDIDRQAGCCSCGFYIGEADARRHGGLVLPCLVNHVFGVLGFHKIWGEVLAGNDNVLKMHDVLGYRPVGVFREHVLKDGVRHDLHLFEMLRADWEERAALFSPYRIALPEVPGP